MARSVRLFGVWMLVAATLCSMGRIGMAADRTSDDGRVTISGDLQQWHKVTLDLAGPVADELDDTPNPFTDYEFTVTFTHQPQGQPSSLTRVVSGYFAADGRAAETGASRGNVWRAHLSPDAVGDWSYEISFRRGPGAAVNAGGEPVSPFHGLKGRFTVATTDKKSPDFRAKGRLQYVGERYLRFAGTGEYFLKAGPDSPETLLACTDFDGTTASNPDKAPLKTWGPHVRDWRAGDPVWRDGRGKGLIGAINYLAEQGCNTISFLPYNAGGDGDNVWPFVARNDKRHYDCSRLDQWQIVFDHATNRGIHLHFKLQENELDDNRRGQQGAGRPVPESLDGGKLGLERKLYCRELVARFGHELGLLWNIGEENTQSPDEQRDMIAYLREIDPYDHHVVIHSFPDQQDRVYEPLLGDRSLLTGASLQNSWSSAHQRTLKWVEASAQAGRPWVVCNDEQNPASDGVPPDAGYAGHDGFATQNGQPYSRHDIRRACLWGTLTAGGAGVEYYFGYRHPENDLLCEDFRSREACWRDCRHALDFFREHQLPLGDMECRDDLVGNPDHDNSRYCLARAGECYLIYLPGGGTSRLDLRDAAGRNFHVGWYDPRGGGSLRTSSVSSVRGGTTVDLGPPPRDASEDWVILVRVASGTGRAD